MRMPRAVAREQERLPGDVPEWERGLNPEQLEVVRHVDGPLAVFAGAGSGKTASAVKRVARLVRHLGVAPDRIFMVTFSRAAADEMAARVRQLGVGGVEVKTWHAFCGCVLREEGTAQGRWTVDEKNRAKTLVKQAGGYQHEKWTGMDLTKVLRFIGHCKANLWAPDVPEAFAKARKEFGSMSASKAIRVYQRSQELIEEVQLLTFDDMLVYTARLFAENEDVRASWAAKFDYVITDEAQDNNAAQTVLARALAKDHRNLMAIGDLGQSIYKFRGANPVLFADFAGEWDARVITLFRNYRSGQKIVDVSNAIIREGEYSLPEDMTSERGVGGRVDVVAADTLDDEARELVEFCKVRLAGGGSLSDVCVLFRLNAQSRAIEDALLKEKLPYVLIGGINFYERKEVKDLLAYLRLAAGRDVDGDAFKRCVNAPFRFLGAKFVERAMAVAASGQCDGPHGPVWTQVTSIAGQQSGIQDRQRGSIREWVEIVERVSEMIRDGVSVSDSGERKQASAADVIGYLLKATDYIAWLEKEEGEESIESSHAATVRELQRVAGSFASVGDLLDFVEVQVRESAQNKRRQRGGRCLTMMSAHRAKGLQWPVVWVVGCNEGILPHAKGDPEEERRIMYVAATRAENHLIVSYVKEMAMRSGVRSIDRSQYLDVFPGGDEDAIAIAMAPEGDSDEELSAYVGEEIVGGMTAAERASVAAYDASTAKLLDVTAQAEDEGRNPGSVREISPTLAVLYGDGVCHECQVRLVEHGEECGA